MAVPRSRLSNARKNIRRSHHAKKAKNVMECRNCKASCLPHRACSSCGHYSGRSVLPTEE